VQFFETVLHLFHPRRSNNHRAKLLHPEAFLALAVIAISFYVVLGPAQLLLQKVGVVLGVNSTITADQVLKQTNDQREKQGLPKLELNDKLNAAALAKAQYMFAKQFWSHNAPDGTNPWKFIKDANYSYSVAGENLARDFATTDEMVAAWMASPTHKANIVNNRYKDIGIAVVDGKLLGEETTLVVQMFGTPKTITATENPPKEKQPNSEFVLSLEPPQLPARQPAPAVLAAGSIPATSLKVPALFSPLQLVKAFFLSIIFVISSTLIYDAFIASHYSTVRLVGKNFAHILLLIFTAFLVIFFKGGLIH
jgi:hypothetical protein